MIAFLTAVVIGVLLAVCFLITFLALFRGDEPRRP